MEHKSRIPVDPEYIKAIGTALYNFAYLEWVVVWMIFTLGEKGLAYDFKKKTSGTIAKDFETAIAKATPPLSAELQGRLVAFHKSFKDVVNKRNELFHSHPYTTPNGLQQLMRGEVKWDDQTVDAVALLFETAAIEGLNLFHGPLKMKR